MNRVRRLIEPSQTAANELPEPVAAGTMSLLLVAGLGVAMAHAAQVNNDPLTILQAAPEAILYDPFLPSPQALRSRYGSTHNVLPNGPDLLHPVPGPLSSKYGHLHNVGRAGTKTLRQDAIYAPLPRFPQSLFQAGKQGLVVIEVAVSPAGRVRESMILASFDREASTAVTLALNGWRFHSIEELSDIFENWKDFEDGIRIGRLGFEFRLVNGKGIVVDLAAAEIKRRFLPNPFLKN